MKINEHTAISTPRILLVPYSEHHVPTYHEWMKDPALQEATASEPLTPDEEYAMQRSWRKDADKLTFIICHLLSDSEVQVRAGEDDKPERMIGDVNLFLFRPDEDSEGVVGELELMIAKPGDRRQGFGRAALQIFIQYVLGHWDSISAEYDPSKKPGLSYLRVKVNEKNEGSIKLFESLAFKRTSTTANFFGEVELRWEPKGELEGWKEWVERRYEV